MTDSADPTVQLATFHIGKELFGLDVMNVQEVTGQPVIIAVPRSPGAILGLVNLRGQISTAIGMRTLFGHAEAIDQPKMSVVCRVDGNLISLVVDSIGDVVEVPSTHFESVPDTLPASIRALLKGIYKLDGLLLSEIDLEKISPYLSQTNELNQEFQKTGKRIAE